MNNVLYRGKMAERKQIFWWMRFAPVLILAVLSGMVAPVAPIAAQDQPPIRIEINAGYAGAYRIAEWFPVEVNIANDGPDVRGVLEWDFPGQFNESTFQSTIDLPRGSQKRVTLHVVAQGLARNGRIRLLDGSTVLATQDVQLEAVDSARFLIGVVSSDAALLNSLNSIQLPGANGALVRNFELTHIPGQAAPLRSLNTLFLHDADTSTLSSEQTAALDMWVRLGGQLIVSGGVNGAQTAAGVRDLLPVEISGDVVQGDLSALARLAPGDAAQSAPTAASLSAVQPRAGAEGLPSSNATNVSPLLFRWNRGGGSITFATFDLAALRGWVGEPAVWQRILDFNELTSPGLSTRQQGVNVLNEVLQPESLNLPSVMILLALVLVYILVVGPLNYMLLRRARRLEWAWVTLPATMLVFATTFYVVGFSLRGGEVQVSQIAIVQGFEGQPRGIATAFVGLFSPRRTRYTVGFNPRAMISESRGWADGGNDPVIIRSTDTMVQAPDILVDVASMRTFSAEEEVDTPLLLQSAVRREGRAVRGEIRNTGDIPLEDALIVQGNSFQQLNTIEPGAVAQVDFVNDSNNPTFPWGVILPQTGSFNRQSILTSLNTSDMNGGALDSRGIYLLTWRSQPAVQVLVNDQPTTQNGLTLYIIRLNG
jgi:hypothetical protein